MSTRSDIIAHCKDGKWRRIYCHFDGYLEGVGKTLIEHYGNQVKIEKLMALGDLSILGEKIGVKHPFDGPSFRDVEKYATFEKRYGKMCRAYGRDRGEKNVEADVFDTLDAAWPSKDTWTEFTYVWDRDTKRWGVAASDASPDKLHDLRDALAGRVTLDAPVIVPFIGVVGRHPAPASRE